MLSPYHLRLLSFPASSPVAFSSSLRCPVTAFSSPLLLHPHPQSLKATGKETSISSPAVSALPITHVPITLLTCRWNWRISEPWNDSGAASRESNPSIGGHLTRCQLLHSLSSAPRGLLPRYPDLAVGHIRFCRTIVFRSGNRIHNTFLLTRILKGLSGHNAISSTLESTRLAVN